jgi:hypothetical protein
MSIAALQSRSRRYAWDLPGYLRAGGTLVQVLEAFQDNYYAPLLRDPQRADRRASVPGMTGVTYCKTR